MTVQDYNLLVELVYYGVFPEEAKKDAGQHVLYDAEEYVVSKILDERKINGKRQYLLEWDSVYYPSSSYHPLSPHHSLVSVRYPLVPLSPLIPPSLPFFRLGQTHVGIRKVSHKLRGPP